MIDVNDREGLSKLLMGFKWDKPRLMVADTIGQTPGQKYLHYTALVLLAQQEPQEAQSSPAGLVETSTWENLG